MNATNPDALAVPAEVVTNRCRIRYHRRGSGRPVIMLLPSELAGTVTSALLEKLPERFRVLVPFLPEPDRAKTGGGGTTAGIDGTSETRVWLACFVEGLGIMEGSVVAAGSYQEAVIELAATMPDQLAKVVLLRIAGAAGNGPPAGRTGTGELGLAGDVWTGGLGAEPRGGSFLEIDIDTGRPLDGVTRIVSFLDGREVSEGA